ncbi:MAG: hypothetical protein ACRENS_01960 [Candidatus Eiseniibacteriota bacterium]
MLPSVSRWLAVPLLAGALASSAPVVRWCPMPWEGVPPAVYLRCSLFSASLPAPRGASCADAASCPLAHSVGRPACDGESCPLAGRSRAFCLSDPGLASVWRPHVHAPRNPSAPVAVLIAALTMTAPAPAISHARGLEPEARPPSADPRSRPPVRAPPGIASFV